jgi:transposase
MRGDDDRQDRMFSIVTLDSRVPEDHPLRPIRVIVDQALLEMSSDFDRIYSKTGRPSIAPERLLRALLLQIFFTVRSERMLMQQLDYNLLFRWFVGLAADDRIWDPTVFTKNRDRLLEGDIAQVFFERVLAQAKAKHLLSTEHFTVDGTLVEAWASQKSFQKKGASKKGDPGSPGGSNPDVDFRGEKRTNETHESKTDPESRLFRKGNNVGAILCYQGHVLMENRNGLVVSGDLTIASGTAEREAALDMVGAQGRKGRKTVAGVAGDKGYDTADFVADLREMGATPHVAQNTAGRRSAIDGRTTRHAGYATSQRRRKLVEQVFGWTKTVGGLRKTRHRGQERVGWTFLLTLAAYNITRLRNLTREATA